MSTSTQPLSTPSQSIQSQSTPAETTTSDFIKRDFGIWNFIHLPQTSQSQTSQSQSTQPTSTPATTTTAEFIKRDFGLWNFLSLLHLDDNDGDAQTQVETAPPVEGGTTVVTSPPTVGPSSTGGGTTVEVTPLGTTTTPAKCPTQTCRCQGEIKRGFKLEVLPTVRKEPQASATKAPTQNAISGIVE